MVRTHAVTHYDQIIRAVHLTRDGVIVNLEQDERSTTTEATWEALEEGTRHPEPLARGMFRAILARACAELEATEERLRQRVFLAQLQRSPDALRALVLSDAHQGGALREALAAWASTTPIEADAASAARGHVAELVREELAAGVLEVERACFALLDAWIGAGLPAHASRGVI